MKRILSLDGGGIRGVIPALVLAEIEARTGKPIAKQFDLIAGTSTGGILALALCKNDGNGKPKYPASALVDIYTKRGKEIFSRAVWNRVSSLGGILDQLYPHDGLENILQEYFGDDSLGTAVTRVFITSYDIESRQPLFIKSWRDEYRTMKMKHAARATSAAPTYFEPAHVPVEGAARPLIDGGIFVNNPTVSAYAEARRIFPEENEFFVVSLGTGEMTRPIKYEKAKDWGKAGWLVPLLSCVFDGVSDAANYQMTQILGDAYIRLQTSLTIASDDMDNATPENIEDLKSEAGKLIGAQRPQIEAICQRLARVARAAEPVA